MSIRFQFLRFAFSLFLAGALSLLAPLHTMAEEGPNPPLSEELPPIDVATETVTPVVPAETEEGVEETELGTIPGADVSQSVEGNTDSVSEEMIAFVDVEGGESILSGDPIWCPLSVTVPKPNLNGCTDSFESLDLLFADLALAPKTADGVIWIAQDYSSTVDATLDGDPLGQLATMRNYRLTIKGGWIGCGDTPPATCSGVIQTNIPSQLNHALIILNWNNDVSISDVWIIDSLSVDPALQIDTTGKIALTRVEVRNNAGAGASLDNSEGSRDVLVTASKFSGNQGGNGLSVASRGAITLSNVIANANGGTGVSLNNAQALSAKNVILTSGVFQFNENSSSGLLIESRGAITLKDITAVDNDVNGAELYNTASTVASGITLSGTNIFSENDNQGLIVSSKGAIKINNLINNANGEYGAWLDNTDASSAQPILITGRSEFKFNGGGLKIESNGAISLANLTATNNLLYEGANLNNASSAVGSGITLFGVNLFDYSRLEGIVAASKGAITIANLTASFNGQGDVVDHGAGAYLDNSGAFSAKLVSLIGTSAFVGNAEEGLFVKSTGPLSLAALSARSNGSLGADMENRMLGSDLPQNVTITGSASFLENGGTGLRIQSYGAINLNGVVATGNNGFGAEFNNGTGSLKRDVTLKGSNTITDNTAAGLSVSSLGNITINLLTASLNDGAGAFLSTNFAGSTGSVNLTGTSVATGNGGDGLVIETRGSIKIGKLTADSNQGIGVSLTGEGPGAITVGVNATNWCNSLSSNRNSGLEIVSKGPITLNSLCNSGNGLTVFSGFGASIDNAGAQSPMVVTLNGTNSFLNNYSGGLEVTSKGALKANNVDASNNPHGRGAVFNNLATSVGFPQNVTLTGVNKFSVNYADGLTIQTYGAITLNHITASSNGYGIDGYGATLDNQTGTITPKAINITGANSFSDNTLDGLRVLSLGAISVGSIAANNNEGNGAYLDNCFWDTDFELCTGGGAIGGIAITSSAKLNVNGANGLDAFSLGKISIANLEAVFNDGHGAYLNNSSASPAQAVVLSGSNTFDQNDLFGLHVVSRGAITISNLHVWNNDTWGVNLDNSAAGSAAAVTITGKQDIGGNEQVGLEIKSNRTITISNLSSSSNGDEGAVIDNTTAGIPQNVTLGGNSVFEGNGLHGLKIATFGVVTLSNITAIGNGFDVDTVLSQHGVLVDNQTGASVPKGVTLTGVNVFSENHDDGLHIESLGLIKLNNLTANENGANGATLDNFFNLAFGGVTLTGANVFEFNDGFGLLVRSKGAVSLLNIVANSNTGGGASILGDEAESGAPLSVKITGLNEFNSNGAASEGNGLTIYASGSITLANITASGNHGVGARLNNTQFAAGSPTITLTNGTFNGNGNTGLWLQSAGSVTVSYIVADGNVGDGINAGVLGNITIACASLTGNGGYGWTLNASTGGTVTLKGVFAYGNWENEHPLLGNFIYARSC